MEGTHDRVQEEAELDRPHGHEQDLPQSTLYKIEIKSCRCENQTPTEHCM